jgi:hypothetical protein
MVDGSSRYTKANGNRFRRNLRVPRTPAEKRSGASEIDVTARSTSRANRKAARSLRSKYHANAASNSRLAASWNSTALLPMRQPRRNPALDLVPWNGRCFPGVQFVDAAANFLVPRVLGALVNCRVQTFHQRARQIRALLLGKRERLLQEIEGLLRHSGIIPRLGGPSHRLKSVLLATIHFWRTSHRLKRVLLEQAGLAAGGFAVEVFVGAGRGYAAAGGAVDHADLHEVGLVHFFDGVFFFA